MTISISRIYAIDDVETCILATGDNAQGLLREIEKAAEQLGAAPAAVAFSGQGAAATKRRPGRPPKNTEPEAAKAEAPKSDPAPALPSGVGTVLQ